MRVTQGTRFSTFQLNLETIQDSKSRSETRMTSGKQIISVSDDPKTLAGIKEIESLLEKNLKLQNNINTGLEEIKTASDHLESIAEKLRNIKQTAIDATHITNTGTISAAASYVKGLLTDIINNANESYNGKFLFAGTKTNASSLRDSAGDPDAKPFELKQGPATATNPSGLSVVFKGNTGDRQVSKGSAEAETISTKADDLFGSGGTALFDSIIGIYNILMFNPDGSKRKDTDAISQDDVNKLNSLQKYVTDGTENINRVNARNGNIINRFESLSEQLSQENLRLKSFRSKKEDADYAETAMQLAKEQTALQYTLQVGAKINQQTLFDFLG